MRATCSSEIMPHLEKRIHPAPSAPADLTDDPAGRVFGARRREKVGCRRSLGGLRSRRRGQVHTRGSTKGRLIRHAGFQAAAVGALAVPMIEASFGTVLVTAVGFAALQSAGFFPATGAAITLAAITMTAEIKNRAAGREMTQTLTKDCGTRRRHRFREGALDNRRRSWQDDSRSVGGPLIGATNKKPRLRKQPGFSSVCLRELILPNPAVPERDCDDDPQSQDRLRR